MTVQTKIMDSEDVCSTRAVMIVPGKVIWVEIGAESIELYDHNEERIKAIHIF